MPEKLPSALSPTLHYTKRKKNGRVTAKRPVMNTPPTTKNRRIILWSLVVIYTFSLPYAIVLYNVIALRWSPEFAGFVPRLILLVAGAAYIFYAIKAKLPFKKMFPLIPCAGISCLIIYLEPNPDKHIHIPEYVFMTWLLFEAIRIDYKGAGIFLLVFFCSSFLGVLDEIFQGIHPLRFYGWQDMIINSSSSFIGILSLIGLRENQWENWNWINQLKKTRGSLFVVLLGISSTAVSCYMLFKVKNHRGSWLVYPDWLIAWNAIFVLIAFITLWVLYRHTTQDNGKPEAQKITAVLWVLPALIIILYIHMVVVLSWTAGVFFK